MTTGKKERMYKDRKKKKEKKNRKKYSISYKKGKIVKEKRNGEND